MLLKDQVALITGASQGIGRAIAQRFAEEGADLVLCARNEEALEKIKEELVSTGRKILVVKTDVRNAENIEAAIRKSLDFHSRINILVNNAGITRDNLLLRMREEDWDEVIETNLKSTFLFTKACAKPMIKQRSGRIINVASIVGIIGNAGQANYAASKAGIIGLTKSAARELASRNVLVNAIAPGFIQTQMTDILPQEQKDLLLKQIPLGRLGDAKQVADTAVFLASPLSEYMTGQVIRVDGGMVI